MEAVSRVPRAAAELRRHVYRNGWIYDYPDAYNGLELWKCDSGNNNTNWCNPKYDALVKKAASTQNNAARTALYQQAESLLTGPNGDMPIMPIYWYSLPRSGEAKCQGLLQQPDEPVEPGHCLHLVASFQRYGQGASSALPVLFPT